jgi:hypothetical protein
MSGSYHDGSRRLQDRFGGRRLANRLDEKFIQDPLISADDRAFIERMEASDVLPRRDPPLDS